MCATNLQADTERITLAIDAPLGFSEAFVGLVTNLNYSESVERSDTNPYLFRETERFLFEHGLKPLSAVKDMIGSQATKGMHVLAKFVPNVKRCGVWGDGNSLTAIEAYPSACRNSQLLTDLQNNGGYQLSYNRDETDALICALVAYLFGKYPEKLIAPRGPTPVKEGWIWVPGDALDEVTKI
ncbi:MAG: hypothetical protein ACLQVJ_07460 [Syntrophobacteraceae bacterium]